MVNSYKQYIAKEKEDPSLPCAWAITTWIGGPGAKVSGGNRKDCRPSCAVSYPDESAVGCGKKFDYVWKPIKPRSGQSHNCP